MDYFSIIAVTVSWVLTLCTSLFAYFKHKENIKIQKEMVKIQTRPNIAIFTTMGSHEINKIEFHIKNYGPGIARNIKFNPIDGGEFITPSGEGIKDLDLIKNGIDTLGRDEERFFVLTNLREKYVEEKMNVNIIISVVYEDENGERYTPKPFNPRLKEFHGLKYSNLISATPSDFLAPTSNTVILRDVDCSGNLDLPK